MSTFAPVLQLRQVSHSFGTAEALDNLTVSIAPGERVALVGSSGAGKSTLLRLLNGTLQPTRGEVWAFGSNLNCLPTRQRRRVQRQIGTVYQQFHLVDRLRVIHNVNAGHLGHWPWWKAVVSLMWPLEVKTAAAVLAQVGIPEKLYARTDQLSGGQQQRVALARVLVQDPAVILADEPIASLDPERSQQMMDLLSQVVQASGKTLVVSLHAVDYARSHCDRIIGLQQGEIVFDRATKEVTSEMMTQLYQ